MLALNFPFNFFALGQDCFKMLKHSYPRLNDEKLHSNDGIQENLGHNFQVGVQFPSFFKERASQREPY